MATCKHLPAAVEVLQVRRERRRPRLGHRQARRRVRETLGRVRRLSL